MTGVPDGIAETSGGTFNRDDPLLYFLAGGTHAVTARYPYVLFAVNDLTTTAALDRFERACDEGKVLLDSGVFNLAMSHARKHSVTYSEGIAMPPEEIDGFDALWDRYAELATKYRDRIWGVVELDQGGVEHKPRTRERIETELGVTPIPVYHPLLDGWDYYDDLARGYDRVCIGNLATASPPVRLRLIWTATERAKQYPYLWTHLLGLTPNANTLAMPYRGSCDSSSWLTAIRWQPSWKAKTMFTSCGNYPPPMWSHAGSHLGKELPSSAHREQAMELMLNNELAALTMVRGCLADATQGEGR